MQREIDFFSQQRNQQSILNIFGTTGVVPGDAKKVFFSQLLFWVCSKTKTFVAFLLVCLSELIYIFLCSLLSSKPTILLQFKAAAEGVSCKSAMGVQCIVICKGSGNVGNGKDSRCNWEHYPGYRKDMNGEDILIICGNVSSAPK